MDVNMGNEMQEKPYHSIREGCPVREAGGEISEVLVAGAGNRHWTLHRPLH